MSVHPYVCTCARVFFVLAKNNIFKSLKVKSVAKQFALISIRFSEKLHSQG